MRHSKCSLAVSSQSGQQKVKVFPGACIVQCFLKRCNAVSINGADCDYKPAVMRLLVFPDQLLPLVPIRMLRLVQRTTG